MACNQTGKDCRRMDSSILKKLLSNHYIIMLLLVFAAYLPTFSGGFLLDDIPLIEKNPYIREFHTLSSYLSQEDGIENENDKGSFHTGYYRPLINLTYNIDYKIWGMNPAGFRLTNWILHVLCCFTLYNLIYLFVKNKTWAFWASLLFSIHPANTESVSWVISRNNILVTMFILLCLYFHTLYWERKKLVALPLSLMAFLCALLSKEFGIMLLPVLFLLHRFILKRKSVRDEIINYIPYILLLLIYFVLRKNVVESYVTPFGISQVLHNLVMAPYLIVRNLMLIFLPYKLHYLYISYPDSILGFKVLVSIFVFFMILIVIWKMRSQKVILFSCSACFLFLFPVLNIIPSASTVVTLVSLRWLYLPMAFLAPGIADILVHIPEKYKRAVFTCLVIITVYLGSYTYMLNKYLWHDEKTFFEQEVIGFDNDFLAGNLAEKYLEEGKFKAAEGLFKIAIDKYKYQVYNYINYSSLLLQTGRPEKAIELLKKVPKLRLTSRTRGEWFNNMGTALFMLNRKKEAISFMKKSVLFVPGEIEFWRNLASAYGLTGEYEKSIAAARKGLALHQNDENLLVIIATGYANLKNFQEARKTIDRLPASTRRNNPAVLRILNMMPRS